MLKTKKERALKVVEYINEFMRELQQKDLESFKKSKTIFNNYMKKENEIKDEFDYIKELSIFSNKLNEKLGDELFKSIKEKINWMNEIKFIVIFDIDDTLRDASHRMPIRNKITELQKRRESFTKEDPQFMLLSKEIDKTWEEFFKEGKNDTPKKDMIELCNYYHDLGFIVKLRTGAVETYKDETINYLKENGVKYSELKMRKENVKIPDYILKPSWIPKYDLAENIIATYDDRDRVNEKYKFKGVENIFEITKDFDVKKHLIEFGDEINKASKFLNKKKLSRPKLK